MTTVPGSTPLRSRTVPRTPPWNDWAYRRPSTTQIKRIRVRHQRKRILPPGRHKRNAHARDWPPSVRAEGELYVTLTRAPADHNFEAPVPIASLDTKPAIAPAAGNAQIFSKSVKAPTRGGP